MKTSVALMGPGWGLINLRPPALRAAAVIVVRTLRDTTRKKLPRAARESPRERAFPSGEAPLKRGVAAGRSAQRACERSSDWRRGGAASPDPTSLNPDPALVQRAASPDPNQVLAQ